MNRQMQVNRGERIMWDRENVIDCLQTKGLTKKRIGCWK